MILYRTDCRALGPSVRWKRAPARSASIPDAHNHALGMPRFLPVAQPSRHKASIKRRIAPLLRLRLPQHGEHMRAQEMTTEQLNLTIPARIAEKAESIYAEKYKRKMEASHEGEFVAIDVLTGGCHLGETAGQALQTARETSPNGVFHLIRVGSLGAFSSSYGWNDGSSVSWSL